jgi:hypothetical protein
MRSRLPTTRPSRRGLARCRRAPASVVATVAVVVGMFFSQLVQLAHFFLVDHVVCEHGDFVHDEARRHEVEPARADASRESVRAADTREKAGHEHCDLRGLSSQAPEVGPSLAEATLLTLIALPAQVAHPERRPRGPLSLAPKGSPPAA